MNNNNKTYKVIITDTQCPKRLDYYTGFRWNSESREQDIELTNKYWEAATFKSLREARLIANKIVHLCQMREIRSIRATVRVA